MKIDTGDQAPIIVGKRVAIGAAINSTAATVAFFFPEHAPAIVSAAVPITFGIQVYVVNRWGITQ